MNTDMQTWLIEGSSIGSRFVPGEPRRAPLGTSGARLGRRPGESLEFEDYRDYQPGDDLRKLDWNVYARSDALVVRVFREEIAPHLDIVLDSTASMAVRPEKHQGTVSLAGVMAGAAVAAGYSTRCWQIREDCEETPGSTAQAGAWDLYPFDGVNDSGEVFVMSSVRLTPRGMRVFISDLLFPSEPEVITQILARGASSAAVVQLLDEPDRTPPDFGTLKLVDSETGSRYDLFVDETVRNRYTSRLEGHTREWELACQRHGIHFVAVSAEEIIEGNLGALLQRGILNVQ